MSFKKEVTKLARKAVEEYVTKEEIVSPLENGSLRLFNERAGVFITIKKEGNFRSCIGTYLPTRKNIAEEIIENAISACTKDYRLGPVKKEELPLLSYEVSILEKPKEVKKIEELDPEKYGIIVKEKKSSKSGLLLPGLEGINTIKGQILTACKKGGININDQEDVLIYRFKVEKYEE